MEQLIIFLLFVIGSIISAVIQKKKQKAEEQQQRELEEFTRRDRESRGTSPRSAPQPPPQTSIDWQEQLRRLLQGEAGNPTPAPPVIIKPVLLPPEKKSSAPTYRKPQPSPPVRQSSRPIHEASEGDLEFKSPLKTSAAQYGRASKLHDSVQARLRAASDQTTSHKPSVLPRSTAQRHGVPDFLLRLRRNPAALREAFIASLIFGPPKAAEVDPGRLANVQ